MLVALGSALFIIAAREAGATSADLTRVVQGIATGIGFVGAGSILKSPEHHSVRGLWLPVLWVGLALGILAVIGRLEPDHPS